jgi:hypothetical protein
MIEHPTGHTMNPFTLIIAIIGGLVAGVLWLVAMASTGGPWGGLAIVVGAAVSAAAILAGSRPNNALAIAVVTLLLCLCAKGLGLYVSAAYQDSAQVAGLNFIEDDYARLMDDAIEFTSVQPPGYPQFIANRAYYDVNLDGVADAAELAAFQDFWAPRLRLWAAAQPPTVEWAAALRADYAARVKTEGRFKQAAGLHFGPLALIMLVLAVSGTYVAVFYISTADAALLDREDRIVAGVIDLNADVGTRINIQMAAPGAKAARKDTRITDRVKRASAGRPTGQVLKPPPPKNELRDQPPGMK